MTPLLIEFTKKLVDVFEELHVPYAFGGAMANNVWGIIRGTQDADCLVSIPQLQFQAFVDRLNRIGCVVRRNDLEEQVTVAVLRDQIDQRKMMDVYWRDLRAELFVPIVPLQDEILRRAVTANLESCHLKVTTAEDLILLKMIFRRSKDIMDVRGVLYTQQGNLDMAYLSQWAARTLDEDAIDELNALIDECESGA